ncbi:hypothetical protein [Bacteriophage Phi NF-1]|uniref:Uncharacterized protein n=1 Tax=Bacteriophage Phi NF-1 TaxID=2900273 RepID=A0A976MFZ3_9CAUD|nr:hypothetical protein [Bacteriophage Phi NF-1]
MELTVNITYFPVEKKYGASLWLGDKLVDIGYNLCDTKRKAMKMGGLLKNNYINKERGRIK